MSIPRTVSVRVRTIKRRAISENGDHEVSEEIRSLPSLQTRSPSWDPITNSSNLERRCRRNAREIVRIMYANGDVDRTLNARLDDENKLEAGSNVTCRKADVLAVGVERNLL